MCTTIIRYSIEELNKIGNEIDSLLSQNIIDNLMEIKLNNKFIKKDYDHLELINYVSLGRELNNKTIFKKIKRRGRKRSQ